MNAIVAGKRWGLRRIVAVADQALRGIGRRQVITAVVLGLVLFVAEAISFSPKFFVRFRPISPPVLLMDLVILNQVRVFVLVAAVVIADRAVDLGAPMRRAYIAAALGGSVLGILVSNVTSWPFRFWMMENAWPVEWLRGVRGYGYFVIQDLTHWVLVASAAVFLYADRRTARRTETRLRAAELNRNQASKSALESRLQAMQARVEPQFLFNTLEHVERLFELDPPVASRMLDDLIAYLRAAMPAMRDTSSTVGKEVALARAFLGIVRLRLGDRFEFSVEAPESVGEARMPPMVLLPLIDHATAHGAADSRAAGSLRIRTTVAARTVRLEMVHSGTGFLPETGGHAIVEMRERLDALFGSDASLVLQAGAGGATEAVLELPFESPRASSDTESTDRENLT